MNEEQHEVEIDLLQLLNLILQKWLFIGLITLSVTVLAGFYAYFMLDDVYTADSSMIVQVQTEDSSDYQNLLYGQRLVDTYTEISESNRVLEELKTNLGLTQSNAALRNMITVNSVNDTLIIKLSVESTNAVEAKNIANEVVTIVQTLSTDFEGLENVEVLDTADTPRSPSGPNRMLYVIIGVLLGGMIGVGIVLGKEFLDKDIKTASDIERVLGLRVLGTIPDYDFDEEGL